MHLQSFNFNLKNRYLEICVRKTAQDLTIDLKKKKKKSKSENKRIFAFLLKSVLWFAAMPELYN